MRSSKSRSRNKSNRQRSTLGNVVNRVFDSSGPEGKVRGTPQQIIEKYLSLARDAQLSGDRVAEQSFLQHAEHYTRMLGEAQKEMAERQQYHQPRQDGEEGREAQPNGNNNGHQNRDGGGREDAGRENGNGNGRDHTRRDTGGRDTGTRDSGGRDSGGRDTGGRDSGNRDAAHRDQQRDQGGRDQAPRDGGQREQPRFEPVAEVREEQPELRQPDPVMEPLPEGLPAAVTTSEGETAGPVETPEAASKPARSRAPRAPRGEKPAAPRTPRGRRKAPEDETRSEDTPATGEE